MVLLAGVLAGLGLIVAFLGPIQLTGRTLLPVQPDVLAAGARTLLQEIGYDTPPVDSSWSFEENTAYLDHLEESEDADRWSQLGVGSRSGLVFWYRQSPRLLVPFDSYWPRMSRTDPPSTFPGMAEVTLDPEGQLMALEVVPPEFDDTMPGEERAPDWPGLLARAGLSLEDLSPAEPSWLPPVHSDTRIAWEGKLSNTPDLTLRVEAASYRGRPVFFRVLGPWVEPERAEDDPEGAGQRVAQILLPILFISILLGAVLLARRNMRLGKSDRSGAFRIAAFSVVTHTAAWLLAAKHFTQPNVFFVPFIRTLSFSLFVGMSLYVFYLALEPYVRRRWPDTIISWTRVLSGKLQDPLVGRDILFGSLAGIGLVLFGMVAHWLPVWVGLAPRRPQDVDLIRLLGARWVFGFTLDDVVHAIDPGMLTLVLLLVLRVILRRQWIAGSVIVLLSGFLSWADSGYWFDALFGAIFGLSVLLSVARLGLLATTTLFFVLSVCEQTAFTSTLRRGISPEQCSQSCRSRPSRDMASSRPSPAGHFSRKPFSRSDPGNSSGRFTPTSST